MSRLIIGMTGRRGNTDDGYVQAQAGKDTAALHLIGKYGFTRIALADGVREALFALNPTIVSDRPDPRLSNHIVLADNKQRLYRLQGIVTRLGWEQAKQIPEVRALMQRMGTEAGREIFGDQVWTNLVQAKMARLPEDQPVVITDVRFPNEAQWLHELGGTIVEVFRPQLKMDNHLGANATHSSETIGWIEPDHVLVNDSNIGHLYRCVDRLMTKLQDSQQADSDHLDNAGGTHKAEPS